MARRGYSAGAAGAAAAVYGSGHARLRPLLASTSLAALLIGVATPAAFAACTLVSGTPASGSFTNSGTNCLAINGLTVTGNVTNVGVIRVPSDPFSNNDGAFGIRIMNSSIGGAVVNSNQIIGPNPNPVTGNRANGLYAMGSGAIISGGIINTGSIVAPAVSLGPQAGTAALGLSGLATFAGGITNTGTISAGVGGNGIYINSPGAVIEGGITNTGTISAVAGNNGIHVRQASIFTGGVTNAGMISAAGEGGIDVGENIQTFTGGITNTGTISATGGPGIFLRFVADFEGGISNAGTISAPGQIGIGVGVTRFGNPAPGATFAGGIRNTGTIIGNTGIMVGSTSPVSVFNAGAITGTGGTAIDASAATSPVIINQAAGVLNGAILLSAHDDVLNVSGGTINGNIVGQANSGTINFDPGAGNTFTYAAPFGFTGVDQVNINSGTVVLNGVNTASVVAVNNLGTLSGTGTVNAAVSIDSGGTLAPGIPGAPGTINLGPLTLNSGSILSYLLGTPNVVGGPNSLTNVNGALIVNGADTVFATNTGTFGVGTYRLINYTAGELADNGTISVGTLPDGATGVIQTSVPGEVNLIVSAAPVTTQFWDGANMVAGGITYGRGGNGTWNNSSTNWTTQTGSFNSSWQGNSAVFAGAPGTVTVADTIAYKSIQFSTDGYVLTASAGGTLVPTGVAPIIVDGGLTATIGAPITGSGGLDKNGLGTLIITGADTYTGGTTISFGTLQLGNGGTSGSILGNVANNGILAFDRSDVVTFPGIISGTGAVEQIGTGTTILTADNTYTGGTAIVAGTLQLGDGGTSGSILGNVANNGILAFDRSDVVTFPGIISGTGAVEQIGTGTTILTADNTYMGGTTISAGTLQLGNGGTSGSILGNVANNGILAFDRSDVFTFGGVISGTGAVQQIGTGTLVLSAANSYTGPTSVTSGILDVTGSIATSSLTTVASGATLTGTGTVGNAQINGGATLAPGNGTPGTFMTVAGNLAFQSGALYMVQVNPATASFTTVSGTASLNGTVNAVFLPGTYLSKQYLILQSAGLGGTTFANLTNTDLPAGFHDFLSYSATDAFLNLTATLGAGTTLNVNQHNVATAISNFFNSGGALPPGFVNLFNLSGASLASALTQLSGENATGAERSSFQLTNEFLNLMLNPYVATSGVAPAQPVSPPPAVYKAPVFKAPVPTFEQRWTVWAAGFGGSGTANGDPVVGSNNVTTSTFGYAAGMDYHYSPDTVLGFALAAAPIGVWRKDSAVAEVTRSSPASTA